MPKFKVRYEWAGHSRGHDVWEIEAANEEEAKEIYYEGKQVEHVTVRDDTERDYMTVEEITP